MVLVCAVMGIAQFLLQTFVSSSWLFTFNYLPSAILLPGFATFQAITYGSALNRSNGFFMLEPSIFSQYLAVAIIIEVLYFRAKWRLAVYCIALLFSYSGTGLIALVVVPGILARQRAYTTIVALVLLAALAFGMANFLHLGVIAERTTEFDDPNTSAYARYIAPMELLHRYLIDSPHNLLWGVGPGTMRDYQNLMPFETHDPPWAKVVFEYGLFGALLFGTLFVIAIFGNSPCAWLSAALAIGFLSFGGEFLDPRLQGLLLVFCVLPKQYKPAPAAWRPSVQMPMRAA
jgi:hypothetical protein